MTLLFRLYWFLRLFRYWNVCKWRFCQLHTTLLLVKQTRNSVVWHMKCFFFAHKTQRKWFLLGLFVIVWLLTGFCVCIFERPFEFSLLDQEMTSLWLVVVTMASVGYGDVFPKTALGRLSVFLGAVFGGALLVSLLTSLILENLVVAHQVSPSSAAFLTTATTATAATLSDSQSKGGKRGAESHDTVFLVLEKQRLEKERQTKSVHLIAVAWRLYVLHNKTRRSTTSTESITVLTKHTKRLRTQLFTLTHDLRQLRRKYQQQIASHTTSTISSLAGIQSLLLSLFTTVIDQFALQNRQQLDNLEKEIDQIDFELDQVASRA